MTGVLLQKAPKKQHIGMYKAKHLRNQMLARPSDSYEKKPNQIYAKYMVDKICLKRNTNKTDKYVGQQ